MFSKYQISYFVLLLVVLLVSVDLSLCQAENETVNNDCTYFPGDWYGYYATTLQEPGTENLVRVYQTTVNLFNTQTSKAIMKMIKPIHKADIDWIFDGSCTNGLLVLSSEFSTWKFGYGGTLEIERGGYKKFELHGIINQTVIDLIGTIDWDRNGNKAYRSNVTMTFYKNN